MIRRFALAMVLILCSAKASAQLAAPAPEPDGFRAAMGSGALRLGFEDLDGAEVAYATAYRLWPSAEAQWGLGQVACARANLGDCAAWLRAALAATLCPLVGVERARAKDLLRWAEASPSRVWPPGPTTLLQPPIRLGAPRAPTGPGVYAESPSLASPAARDGDAEWDALRWTGVSMALVAVLAGTLVAVAGP